MRTSSLFVLSSLLLLAATPSSACRCAFADFPTQYYRSVNAGSDVVAARVVRTLVRTRPSTGTDERVYVLRVVRTYNGCRRTPYIARATTAVSSAACGVSLQRRVTYILPLARKGLSRLSSCGLVREAKSLSKADRKFLRSRETCCRGRCECKRSPTVNCLVDPCKIALPACPEAKKCVSNYCGGCNVEWFTADNLPACTSGPVFG